MARKTTAVNITLENGLKEEVQNKLNATGGRLSTFVNVLLRNFVNNGGAIYPIWSGELIPLQKAQLYVESTSMKDLRYKAGLSSIQIGKIKRHEQSVEALNEDEVERLVQLYENEIQE